MRIPKRHSLAVLGAAGALAATMSFVAAPTATASSSLCNPDCSAAADFKSLGEKLVTHDYEPDGVGAVAYIYNNGAYAGRCLNTSGYNAPPVTCDFFFAEGSSVSYYVCNWEGGPFYCSGWRDDTA